MQIPSDSLRRLLDTVFESPAYAWRSDDATLNSIARWWRDLIAWISQMRAANPEAYRIFVAALIAVLLAILLHALWVFIRTLRGAAEPRDVAHPERVAERPDAAWHLRTADGLAAEGRCREALQHAFVSVALRLDEAGRVAYHPSRTPAEIAREARVGPAEGARLQAMVQSLYAAVFGGAPCGPNEYHAWRALADREWDAAAH